MAFGSSWLGAISIYFKHPGQQAYQATRAAIPTYTTESTVAAREAAPAMTVVAQVNFWPVPPSDMAAVCWAVGGREEPRARRSGWRA